jgi:hypothetical protein
LKSFSNVCGDVIFSPRCRFFVIFQPFFDPSKRPPKWPKNGAPSWSLCGIKNDHDKHTCEIASSSAYVHLDYFVIRVLNMRYHVTGDTGTKKS